MNVRNNVKDAKILIILNHHIVETQKLKIIAHSSQLEANDPLPTPTSRHKSISKLILRKMIKTYRYVLLKAHILRTPKPPFVQTL